MAEDDWTFVPKVSNKWHDEEDEDIKENWDDEDEDDEPSKSSSNADASSSQQQPKNEKSAEQTKAATASSGKKKKKDLFKKLAEKDNEKPRLPRTAEEMLADKLEQQRLVEESDLSIAKETFGLTGSGGDSTAALNSIRLATKEDFETFRKALDEKLTPFARSVHYVTFLDNMFRSLASSLDADDIKKLNSSLTALYNEKIKLQKQTKGKKGKKPQHHGDTVVMERDNDYSSYNQYQDDFEDYF